MKRNLFLTFTALMWVALPLTALGFWEAWDHLPARMATHFDAGWQPNGWMARESALWFALIITAIVLAVFTAILLFMYWRKTVELLAWAMLVFSYGVIGFVFYVNSGVVSYNESGTRLHLFGPMSLLIAAAVVTVAAFLGTHRGSPLDDPHWIATETHASPLFGCIVIIPLGVMLTTQFYAHDLRARLVMLFPCVLFLVVGVFAWKGFDYLFGPAGVEIRTVGFRLRSIPLRHILHYEAAGWNPLLGYGIRGLGRSRAYVWGNKGVRVHTTDGEVFLGHSAPEKILHDLDAIRQVAR